MSDPQPPQDDSSSPPPPPPPDLSPPPGYTAYANAPTPGETIRRVRGISIGLLIATGLVALLGLVGPILMLGLGDEAQTFLADPTADGAEDAFRDSLSSLSTFNLILGPVQLATALLSMIWMYRLSKNVRAFGRNTIWSPLFAYFGWFLPPVLFVIPLLMLRELWKASSPLPTNDADSWKSGGELPALWMWFALFGVLPLLMIPVMGLDLAVGFVGDLESLAERIDENGNILLLNGVGSFLAGIAWMVVVRRMTDRHTMLTGEA